MDSKDKKASSEEQKDSDYEVLGVDSPGIGGNTFSVTLDKDWFIDEYEDLSEFRSILEDIFTIDTQDHRSIVLQRYCLENGPLLEDTGSPEQTPLCDNPDCFSCSAIKSGMKDVINQYK